MADRLIERLQNHNFIILILNKIFYSKRYYEYNTSVMRELLGFKLTQRQRKDLDDISEKTGVRVRSCRRQVIDFSLRIGFE